MNWKPSLPSKTNVYFKNSLDYYEKFTGTKGTKIRPIWLSTRKSLKLLWFMLVELEKWKLCIWCGIVDNVRLLMGKARAINLDLNAIDCKDQTALMIGCFERWSFCFWFLFYAIKSCFACFTHFIHPRDLDTRGRN